MKILLIGGTGTLSSDTTKLCLDLGYDVYLFNRGNKNKFQGFDNLHIFKGDINNKESAQSILKGYNFDVVVDYLTYNLETLKRRIELFEEITKQYVFISSATVFPVNNSLINESSTIGNDGWAYAKDKLECEEYLRNHKDKHMFCYTIVRPYVTYGISRIPFPVISKADNWNLIYRISNNLPIIMCGDGNQMMTLTHTRDFAKGIVGLFQNGKAYNDDFNIVGDSTATWNEVVGVIENILGVKAHVVYVDIESLCRRIPEIADEIKYDKGQKHLFDNSKIKNVVNDFSTTINVRDGLEETVNYLISTHKTNTCTDSNWNSMENYICSKYGAFKKCSLMDRFRYYLSYSSTAFELKKTYRKIMQ